MALTNDNEGSVYIRVELPRVHGKYRAQYDLIQYIDHPITGEKAQIDRQTMECDYDLAGPNIFEQCYVHAKEKLPYATLDC